MVNIETNMFNSAKNMHGEWNWKDSRGNICKREFYIDGYKDGVYQEFFEDGSIKIDGFYLLNRRHGKWVVYNKKGVPTTIGYYKNDEKSGRWVERKEKTYSEGTYSIGEKEDLWLERDVETHKIIKYTIYSGGDNIPLKSEDTTYINFTDYNNYKQGYWEEIIDSDTKHIGRYINDKKEGHWIVLNKEELTNYFYYVEGEVKNRG